jgi:hypothetical protein
MKLLSLCFRPLKSARLPRAYRPRLEILECRAVPSTVTNLNDAGAGSLRQAIIDTPAGGTVDFQPGLRGTITLTTGELSIAEDLTIAGPGASRITISANKASRNFDITASVTVAIAGLTIADGGRDNGSGILNSGTLTVTDCALNYNQPYGLGTIWNIGTLILTSSTVNNNYNGIYNTGTLVLTSSTVSNTGTGIWNTQTGMATVTDSTLSGNHDSGIFNYGTLIVTGSTVRNNFGGIENNKTGMATVTDSTINGNSASVQGGGIFNSGGMLAVTDSTITANYAPKYGGGIDGSATLRNTIIAGNKAPLGPDVYGNVHSQGYNLIGEASGDGHGFIDTDQVGTHDNPIDPVLGPLQDNGGPTLTQALLAGSPALNAGDPAQLGSPDQRGVVRSGGVNIGAYQASASRFVLTAPARVTAGMPFDLTVTAVDIFGQVAAGYTGTVTFSTTDPDPAVVLPADYPFTLADGGVHTFADTGLGETTLQTRGRRTITTTDTQDGSILGSVTVKVRDARHASRFLVFVGGFPSRWAAYLYGPERPGQDDD